MIDGGGNGGVFEGFVVPFVMYLVILTCMVVTVWLAFATGGLVLGLLALFVQSIAYLAFISELSTSKDPTYLSTKSFASVMGLLFACFGLAYPPIFEGGKYMPLLFFLEQL